MPQQLLYVLDLAARNVGAELLINDVVVSELNATVPTREQVVINPWVSGGENRLDIRVKPFEKGAPQLDLRIMQTWRAPDAPENVLLGRKLPDVALPLLPGGPAGQTTESFKVDRGFGPWAWQTPGAQRYRPGQDDAAILQTVFAFNAALERRDEVRVMQMLHLTFIEMARALQLAPEELAADEQKRLRYLFAQPNWSLKSLNPAELVLRPMAGGMLVAPLRRSRSPLIESAGGAPFQQALMLAYLPLSAGGMAWQIVR